MINISNETLMAFGDGELSPEEARAVRAAVESNIDLQNRLRRMQAVDDLLRASVQTDLTIPARFSKLLEEDKDASPSNVVSLNARKQGWKNWLPTGVGVAAAFLIVMGSTLVAPARVSWLEQVDDGLALSGPVLSMITTAPSGKHIKFEGLNMMSVVSFQSTDGRLCREAQLDDHELAARILVCRDVSEDEWCIEAFARMPTQQHKGGYYAAGVPKDPVIDAAYARLGRKATLTAEQEKAAIAANWTVK